jgi:hypothetical protein
MAGARDYEVDLNPPPQYGPPNMAAQLFSMISSIPNAYQEGVKQKFERGQMARTERLQQPIGLDGTDYSTLVRKLLEAKGTEAIPEVLPTAWKSEFAAGAGRPQPWDMPGGGPNMTPDAQGPRPLQAAVDRQTAGGAAPDIDSQGRNRGPTNIRQLAVNAGIDPSNPDFQQHFGSGNLDLDLSPNGAKKAAAEIKEIKAAGMFGPQGDQSEATASFDQRFGSAVPGPRGGPAQGPAPAGPQAAMAPAGAGPGAGSGLVPPGWLRGGGRQTGFPPTELGYAQWLQAQAQRNGILGFTESAKTQQAHAEKILDAIKQAGEPTGPQKEARDTQVNLAKAAGKLGEEVATAKGKRIGEIIEAGGLANRQTVNTLNVMEDAMRHAGSNISTGPGAEQWLKVKQAANNLFPDLFKGVPESETVVKLNAQLASAAAKAMTARPSQLEFKGLHGE